MFTPSNPLLGSLQEGAKFSFNIKYFSDDEYKPVTIQPLSVVSSVAIGAGTISGFFSDSFDHEISYVDFSGTVKKTNSLKQVPASDRGSIVQFIPDPVEYKSFFYTASSEGETKVYEIQIQNDFFRNRNLLMKFVNKPAYDELVVDWLNNQSNLLNWFAINDEVDWIVDVWPWLEE